MAIPSLHIVLVEAENHTRQVIAGWLSQQGHRVSLLETPDGLLAALAEGGHPADLIVVDLPTDQAGGVAEGLERVHRRFPWVHVVLRVSSARLPAVVAARCGVHGYLTKPFRPEELELVLVRLAEGR